MVAVEHERRYPSPAAQRRHAELMKARLGLALTAMVMVLAGVLLYGRLAA